MNYCRLIISVVSVFFLKGCLEYKKKEIDDICDSSSYKIITTYEKLSQDEASLLGLIWLPNFIEQSIYKKNDSICGIDSLYSGNVLSFKKSYDVLKKMYIGDGWTMQEEVEADSYLHVFFKKVDKEIVLFIEEKEIYNKATKKREWHICLHQSLLIL